MPAGRPASRVGDGADCTGPAHQAVLTTTDEHDPDDDEEIASEHTRIGCASLGSGAQGTGHHGRQDQHAGHGRRLASRAAQRTTCHVASQEDTR